MDTEKLYGGIDTHKENFVGYIMDKGGRLVREHSFPATKEAVEKFSAVVVSKCLNSLLFSTATLWLLGQASNFS